MPPSCRRSTASARFGLEIFTDGEFRRASWITDMADAVEGFVPQSRTIEWRGHDGSNQSEASTSNVVGGRLRRAAV